ncbi:MAG: ribosomal protein S18-alanine N-acetyltransferase [Dehalococcoidia bacterium]
MRLALRTRIRPLSAEDIAQVMDIEAQSFPSMWPQTAYKRELQNKLARYLVLTELRDPPPSVPAGIVGVLRRAVGGDRHAGEFLLGFVGMWVMAGEAHIVTIAVRDEYRRMGIGERLVIACLELAMDEGQEAVSLEVRKSNEVAQRLYAKYGFDRVGLRVRYYTDNNEDAALMTVDVQSRGFHDRFDDLRAAHRQRYPDLWD